jgi:hypothetical protein
MSRGTRQKVTGTRLFVVLLFLGLMPLFPGCATEKPKPWEHTKPKWYELNVDPDDRDFYRNFFFGR